MSTGAGPIHAVLLIDDFFEWTGTEVHLLRLLRALDPARVRATLVVVGRDDLVPELRALGITLESLGIHHTLRPEGLIGVARIARLLRRVGADLLVTYHTAADILGPPAALLAGVPVLSCRRDEGFTKDALHLRAQRPINRLLRGMIAVSHSVVRAVERAEGYPAARQQVIWNGEDLSRFCPGPSPVRRDLGLPAGAVVVVSVSLLSPVKDHAVQIEAVRLARERCPNLVLLLAGDGPLRAELERRAGPLGDAVRFLGHRKDVPDLLRAADVFVQTSTSEGFSNAILQAMATALPVVVTRVGGNPELVGESGCGYLIEPKDPAALADLLVDLASDPDRRAAVGRRARERVERYGAMEAMTEAYMDAFERAVTGRFPGPSSGT